MRRRILGFVLAQPTLILGLTLAFAVAGVVVFHALPIEAFPELADPQVYVITLFPGHAEGAERQVTLPIEQELNGVPGLTSMRSISLFGLLVMRRERSPRLAIVRSVRNLPARFPRSSA